MVPERHQFCGGCGAAVREEVVGRSSSQDTQFFGPLQTPGRAKLIVIRGEGGDGVSYALNASDHVAGRSSGVILFPDDYYLSREHANFSYRDDSLFLKDSDSLNGTYVRIREPHYLADGDYFSCGQQILRVELHDELADEATDDGTLHYLSPNRKERFRLVQVLEGGVLGKAISSPVDELTVGKEGCDLTVPDDVHLSHRHAKVSMERDGRVLLSDLGSMNGTFVRIKGEVCLQHGDYVFIGHELLRVEIAE